MTAITVTYDKDSMLDATIYLAGVAAKLQGYRGYLIIPLAADIDTDIEQWKDDNPESFFAPSTIGSRNVRYTAPRKTCKEEKDHEKDMIYAKLEIFIRDHCVKSPELRTPGKFLLEAFNEWANLDVQPTKTFPDLMARIQKIDWPYESKTIRINKVTVGSIPTYIGIGLRDGKHAQEKRKPGRPRKVHTAIVSGDSTSGSGSDSDSTLPPPPSALALRLTPPSGPRLPSSPVLPQDGPMDPSKLVPAPKSLPPSPVNPPKSSPVKVTIPTLSSSHAFKLPPAPVKVSSSPPNLAAKSNRVPKAPAAIPPIVPSVSSGRTALGI